MNSTISAVIITKNEETNIKRCIQSLHGVAEEILVIDSFSTDRTVKIAKENGAVVYQTEWRGYAKTKNFGNKKASYNYILSIDADEELDQELKQSVIQAKKDGLTGTYSVGRLTNYCGTWIRHSGWYPDIKIRLFNKDEVFWEGNYVHETLNTPNNISNALLKGHLNHYSYKSKEDHKERADRYSTLTAEKMASEGKTANSLTPYASGLFRFIQMYILKRGFLDGVSGFKIASISSKSNIFKYKELRRIKRKEQLSKNLNHVCISRTDNLGDVMLTLPLAKAIKLEFPAAKVSFLGKDYTKPLVDCCSSIDQFISINEFHATDSGERIREYDFDAVIHVLPTKKWSLAFKRAGVNLRIGTGRRLYNLIHCNKLLFYSRKKSDLNESQLNLKMLEGLCCKSKFTLEDIRIKYDFRPIDKLPESFSALQNSRKKIILHPKSQGSAPEWDTSKYTQLAEKLVESGFQVYISGTETEGEKIRSQFTFSEHLVDITGKLSLSEFITFIDTSEALVAASTGPLHIAAALQKVTLGLYVDQRPMHALRWGPVGTNASFIESNSSDNQLNISVDEVFTKLNSMLTMVKQEQQA